jgi:hypothetical protein
MLVRVEVRTSQGSLLTLPLDDTTSGLIIEEIEGLDPVNATLVSSSFAGQDGEQYHSARRESRNIKLKIGLEPDYVETSVADLRKRLYGFFMPKSEVSLRFVMDDDLYVDILGRVETFETPLFTQEPEADISLMCFDPDFVDPNPVSLTGVMSVTSSSFTDAVDTIISYAGTVETGGVFTIRPDRSVTAFTFYLRPPDGTLRQLDFSIPLVAGDTLEISTLTGAKGVTLTRANVDTSALYGVSPQSAWLEFQPGDNYLRLYLEGTPIPYDLTYDTRYGGL